MLKFLNNFNDAYSYNDMQEDSAVMLEMIGRKDINAKSALFIELFCTMLARYINSKSQDMAEYLKNADIEAEEFWNSTNLKRPYREDWKYERFT